MSVNSVAAAALAILVLLDYQQEVAERVKLMRGALGEEATTLLPALRKLADEDELAVQKHIDVVCGRMREAASPGHHIAVRWGEHIVQANSHGRSSPELLRAMERAANLDDAISTSEELIVGSDSDGAITVYVSERTSNVLSAARGRAMQRAAALAGLILVAAFAVNLILVRVVVRPVRLLAGTVRQIGSGNLGALAPDSSTAELSVLAEEINSMSASLRSNEEARLRELDRAREIQEQLSQIPPSVPGMTVSHIYSPADEVAGDYYDLLPLPDGAWLLCVADVVGHGIPAAMGAAILKTLLVEATEARDDPARILAFVNERYCRVSLEHDFATAVLVRWDRKLRSITYASAGHEPTLLMDPTGSCRHLASTGMVLGLRKDTAWRTETIPVPDGSRLLLATDGVTESRGPGGELFGDERLEVALRAGSAQVLESSLAQVERAVSKHRDGREQSDDVTLLLAQFGEPR